MRHLRLSSPVGNRNYREANWTSSAEYTDDLSLDTDYPPPPLLTLNSPAGNKLQFKFLSLQPGQFSDFLLYKIRNCKMLVLYFFFVI